MLLLETAAATYSCEVTTKNNWGKKKVYKIEWTPPEERKGAGERQSTDTLCLEPLTKSHQT